MSDLQNTDDLRAKVAVKVPRPDSLVEVRVTPPESNFEVKVLPGEGAIELLIRPGGSLVEVRIGPPAAGAPQTGPAPEDPGDGEVLTGVSQAEFEAMIEEDHGAEARKILDQMDEGRCFPEDRPEAAAETETAEEAPTEEEEEGEAAPVIQTVSGTLPPELDPANPAFKLPAETVHLLLDEAGPPPPPDQVEALADPAFDFSETAASEPPDEAPAAEEAAEEVPVELEPEPDDALETEAEDPAGPSAPEAVREALARLSAAIGEERGVLEAPPPEQAEQPEPPAQMELMEPPAGPDSTVMVELYDDVEPVAGEPAPPLSEEDQLDLSPMENQEEELALGSIDIAGLEGMDLEKSHQANGTVVKAKPMVKAAPSGTIVPA